jgi:hypothetical protein
LLDDPELLTRAPETTDASADAFRAFFTSSRSQLAWMAHARLAPLVELPPLLSPADAEHVARDAGLPMAIARRDRLGELSRTLHEWLGFELPDDFYAVWDLACTLGGDPIHAFEDTLALRLTGPFEAFAFRLDLSKPAFPQLRDLNERNAPELFDVLIGAHDCFQCGYWLDDPAARPSWIVSFFADDGYDPNVCGRTLVDELRDRVENNVMHAIDDGDRDDELERLAKLRTDLLTIGTRDRPEHGVEYSLRAYDDMAKLQRRAIIAAPTLENVGIVVPPETYERPALFGPALRRALERDDGAHEVEAAARAALAEGLVGTALELAKGLWCGDRASRARSRPILVECYRKLDRPLLARAAEHTPSR